MGFENGWWGLRIGDEARERGVRFENAGWGSRMGTTGLSLSLGVVNA